MTRTDTTVVGTLVVLLAIIAGLVGIPALQATSATPSGTPLPTEPVSTRPYREGVLGHPISVSPLTARTQADRDLVALVFSGLVRNGPDGTLVPDLAARWSVDASGREWTFDLQPDARWQDGEPVTADDVVFTIQTLQDVAYVGPAATSWSEVTVRAASPTRVVFTLAHPLAGFLQAATQPIAPAHLLAGVPVGDLATDPFGGEPIGSGPFALTTLDDQHAVLRPSAEVTPSAVDPGDAATTASDSLASQVPTPRPTRPTPYLGSIELRFFDDPAALGAAYRSGALDGASGLPPEMASQLATSPDSRLLRYPGSTLTTVLLDQRPDHPEFRDPGVRTALLEAIDRRALIETVWSSIATPAAGPIPASSPWFDLAAEPSVPFSRAAAKKALKAAGWTQKDGAWLIKGAKTPLTIEVLSPDAASNPAAFAAAAVVASDWAAIGLTTRHVGLPAATFVNDRLSAGRFSAAVTDVNIGLDPDLYPLLASSQTRTGGSNVAGVQDAVLDKLLDKARAPGTDAARKAAYVALQRQLAKSRYLLPLAFQDESLVLRDTVSGPTVRQVSDAADRFWDVLTWRLAADR